MKLDITFWGGPDQAADFARRAESAGVDGVRVPETRHNPFISLALMAQATSKVQLGTAVAVAFARSPTVLAHLGWDLAALSDGRFDLGLGTQVRGHIERRLGVPWTQPIPKLRETVQAVRAVWDSWRSGERLNYRGEHYKLTLMTPFFSPDPAEYRRVPISTAGVNAASIRLAGEIADGFHLHPIHTRSYLVEVIRPRLEEGAARAGRSPEEIEMIGSAFVICGRTDAERDEARAAVRQQIAFYASTPSYRAVLAHHGWSDVQDQLSDIARRGEWDAMPELITDEMLAEFAVEGTPEEIGDLLLRRYEGLVDRLSPYGETYPPGDGFWRDLASTLHSRG